MADIFDEIIDNRKDIFDEVESDRIGDKIFEEVEKELPSLVRSYVKDQTKKIKTLTPKEISDLVDTAIASIPKPKPVEKIIEKTIETRIEVVPPKDHKKYAELSQIEELKKQIEELKKLSQREPDVRVIGEMLPNHNGISGLLQSDGNKLYWGTMVTTEYALKLTEDGDITYVAKAAPGSLQSEPVWQVKKINEATGMVITWADGNDAFDNVATDLTSLTYL